MEEQIALAAIPIHKITTNFRDKGLLAHLSLNFCRRVHIAQPFRDASDYEGFLAYATRRHWSYMSKLRIREISLSLRHTAEPAL